MYVMKLNLDGMNQFHLCFERMTLALYLEVDLANPKLKINGHSDTYVHTYALSLNHLYSILAYVRASYVVLLDIECH